MISDFSGIQKTREEALAGHRLCLLEKGRRKFRAAFWMEVSRSEVQHIRSLVRQAALYRAQGLLAESRGKYEEILSFLGSNQQFQNVEKLAEAVRERLQDVNRDLAEVRSAPSAPELSPQLQSLIKKLFTFSKTREVAAMAGATALAKFEQYEEAVGELQKLLKEGILPTVAAKNILRCYLTHTIIPAFITRDGRPWISFGLMGGDMQPQGHVQIVVNLIDFGMGLQEAGDAPRIYHWGSSEPTGEKMTEGGIVALETGLDYEVIRDLANRGHTIQTDIGNFGGYQAIMRHAEFGTWFGASESRKDGQAAGY